jgi:Holliday junction resolvase RusA-like endonuclease
LRDIIDTTIDNPMLISTNDQYMHPVRKCRDGKYRSYFCKSPALKELQDFYKDILLKNISDDIVSEIQESVNNGKCLSVKFRLHVPSKEFYDHDASNFIKALEDCLSSRIGVDDSRNSHVSIKKIVSPDDIWRLNISVTIVEKETG